MRVCGGVRVWKLSLFFFSGCYRVMLQTITHTLWSIGKTQNCVLS